MGLLLSAAAAEEPLVLTVPLEAAIGVSVFAYSTGIVASVWGDVGDVVVAGDTLAVLEQDTQQRAAAHARLVLQKAQARKERGQALHRQGGFSTQALEGLSLEWEEARLRWLEAQGALNRCVLTAPVNGIVAECPLQKGARLAAGARAFRLIDPTDLKAVLFIPADRMPGIRLGQAVTAQAEALGVSLPGQLIRVSPLVDPTSGTCRVEAHFVGGGRLVRPGTLVQIHFSDNPSPAQGEGTP